MLTPDKCCTITPYFKVHEGKMDEFKSLCRQFMEKVSHESECLFYGFSFSGNEAHCREGYASAEGLLHHNQNVAELFIEIQKISTLTRLELHGPEEEIKKLRQPLAAMNPQIFILEYGFRRVEL